MKDREARQVIVSTIIIAVAIAFSVWIADMAVRILTDTPLP